MKLKKENILGAFLPREKPADCSCLRFYFSFVRSGEPARRNKKNSSGTQERIINSEIAIAFSSALVAAFLPAKVAYIASPQIGHKRSRGHSRPSPPLFLQRAIIKRILNPVLTCRRVLDTKHSITEPLSSCKRCTSSMISNFTS